MKININSVEELPRAAKEFAQAMGNRKHFAFDGPMGTGKTTFIAALCKELGCVDEASSPTFSIVNEYEVSDGKPVYHFDFYRIESEAELLDMGVEDYWYNDSVCLIEWHEMAEGYLPEDLVVVKIYENEDSSRTIEFDEDSLD